MVSTNTRMTAVRRGLYSIGAGGLLATAAAGASLAILAPTANAAPAPATPDQCSVSGIATTNSSVSASMGSYLQEHPETDKALTDISKQSPDQAPQAYRVYFTENPQVAKDLKQIQQPVSALSESCHTQVGTDVITDALGAV
ncbi:heme-binding protein [Gordonia sp. (in: high G+C Gram-positive bacteria)]|uniref:heme-binding protein n=1 Tax=Gordonia sp. (in: high G+C Gram-positive bacteria) TaxID=84139 RepID=UPI0025C2FF4F|nr:heme-binding protein [Gordonia sp. (in: high G+C Gram-positive bacteria)]